jgi:N,N-dimethylformamidase
MSGELTGYADEISVAPGETIAFKVSTTLNRYDAAIVRLIHGDVNGPGFKEEVVAGAGHHVGRIQTAHCGSYLRVEDHPKLTFKEGFTVQMWIFPTSPQKAEVQGLLAKRRDARGYAVVIGPRGDLGLWLGDGKNVAEIHTGRALRSHQWHFIAVSFDARTGTVCLYQKALTKWQTEESKVMLERATEVRELAAVAAPLLMAAAHLDSSREQRPTARGHYNGKLDRPVIFDKPLSRAEIERSMAGVDPSDLGGQHLVASWNFSLDIAATRVTDTGPNELHGVAVNMPARGVTGYNWRGVELDFKQASAQYGAIHFHDDDIEDAGWETDFVWRVPPQARSGFYAARLTSGKSEDHIPFFVRPPPASRSTGKALLLVPTMTYLAYANARYYRDINHWQKLRPDKALGVDELDTRLDAHPEWGLSIYDVHSDGSGCCHSSRLRPIPSLRPKYRQWQFGTPRHLGADLYLVDWLESKAFPYDVVTDHDLHREGKRLLEPYKVVLTGTHPEYWTTPMRQAMESYLEAGGRQMYLGGNGYYWVTSVHQQCAHVIEVRRGLAGSRAWNSAPGELYHSSTGELGGLWRHRGKPPNEIVGVGFKAMGDGPAQGYRRKSGSFDARAAFIFEGIAADEVIGNFGLVLGGAAGDELDCMDYELQTPPHALLLACAHGHGANYVVAVEDHRDLLEQTIAAQKALTRADMVYFETGRGGAVFSVGSISWCGSLSHNHYDNNVSRITANVLRQFIA